MRCISHIKWSDYEIARLTVCVLDGGQAVGDHDRGAALGNRRQRGHDGSLWSQRACTHRGAHVNPVSAQTQVRRYMSGCANNTDSNRQILMVQGWWSPCNSSTEHHTPFHSRMCGKEPQTRSPATTSLLERKQQTHSMGRVVQSGRHAPPPPTHTLRCE
jgi:hypothetical protein